MLVTVDTGGTKTLIASFTADGELQESIKFPTPPNPDDYVSLLRQTLQDTYGNSTVEAIVVALPGIIKDGVAIWCNNLGWKNFEAQRALEGVLGDAPIIIENDANLAGLAETRSLEPIPASSLYVTISTGIGTGIITDGKIDDGLRHSEAGRTLIEFEDEEREWEHFASGQAIYKEYGQYARDITDPVIWADVADRISRGFLIMIPMLQPSIIIIGGSIGTYFDQYSTQLQTLLTEQLPAHIPCPPIVQAKHPEEAVLYGCYYYALDCLATT
jgi:glucokinase